MTDPKSSKLHETVSNIMKIFNEEYPGKFNISQSRLAVWCQMLRECNPETVLAAAYHLVSTRPDWPPDIATVRRTVVYLSKGQLERPDPMGAWGNVIKKLNNSEIELTQIESEAVKRVSSIGDLRRSTNQTADRARFVEAFNGILDETDREWLALPEVKAIADKNAVKQLESDTGVENRLNGIVGEAMGRR